MSAASRSESSPAPVRGWRLTERSPDGRSVNPTIVGHGVLSASLIAAGAVLYLVTAGLTAMLAERWKVCPSGGIPFSPPQLMAAPAEPASLQLPAELSRILDQINRFPSPIPAAQKARLAGQVRQIWLIQVRSCEVGLFYFANRNAALTVSTAAGILAIGSLAFVSRDGWKGASNVIINIGITSGLLLFSTWTFSQLYAQSKNYENQVAKFAQASRLLNLVASAVANAKALRPASAEAVAAETAGRTVAPDQQQEEVGRVLANEKDMARLILFLDTQLEGLNTIDFTGDASFAERSLRRLSGMFQPQDAAPAP